MLFSLNLTHVVLQSIDFNADLLNYLTSIWPAYFIPFGLVIIFLMMNPEKGEKWGSILYRIISFLSRKAERRSVSGDIQSRLNSFVKKYQIDDVLPYGIKFKWVTKQNFESFVESGEVIVIMDTHKNNARNFLNALLAWTEHGLLPQVRHFIPDEIIQATELTLQEKIILSQRSDALKIFREEIVPQKLAIHANVDRYKSELSNLDKKGYFDTMFLSEMSFAGGRLHDYSPSDAVTECNNFIAYLTGLANRQPFSDTTLSIENNVFKVSFVIVAISSKIKNEGLKPYINRIKEAVGHQDSIYVLIRKTNFILVDSLIRNVESNTDLRKIWKKVILTLGLQNERIKEIICLFR